MGNHIETLGLRECHVRVNLSCPTHQIWLPIQQVIPQIWGLPNPIRKVEPLISHICQYPPYHSNRHPPSLFLVHNSTIITQYKVKSFHAISPCHDDPSTPCTVYTESSIHRVHHSPCTAYTKFSSIHPRLSVFPALWRLQVDPWMQLQLPACLRTGLTTTSQLSMRAQM